MTRSPHRIPAAVTIPLLAALVGCAPPADPEAAALTTITADDLARHIRTLSSDRFEGRFPSSPGEERTIEYLKGRFESLGLRPGNGDSFFQDVPLVSIAADPDTRLVVEGGTGTSSFAYGDQFMAWTTRVVRRAEIVASDMVFVGYGTVAPEFEWDDYAGIDVRGRTVVMLVNDPGFATKDEDLFEGRAMTYYGRWTYKFEEAARQGAAGAFIVHETEPAAYPWEVVRGSWSGEQFGLVSPDRNMSRAAVEGWVTQQTARALFSQAGLDFDALKEKAARRGFRAVPMGLTTSVALDNTTRESTSRNVLALLRGRERPDEYVIYMAHWDHLGTDPDLEGDSIYNGALDNASGTATLLELAEAFASLDPPPARSIVFLATTAEEQGLLGSAFYAANPVYPPEKTVAAINMDGANIWGPMRDVTIVGYGKSELDDYVARAARRQGRRVRPDPEPEKGFYYRSDHFTLAKVGIPALYTDAGIDHVEHGEEWGRARRDEYTAERYHKPSDEFDPGWDLSGAVDDARLLFMAGYRLANGTDFPSWREGTEFKARRDAMMAAAR
ncbi:MAG: M28 family peptidase [Acidobacteriota bacterium]